MFRNRTSLLALLCVFFAATTATATDLGDPAPPLEIKEWIKGGPIDLKDGRGKNVYVVEFWATWCPPCLTSIPHLTELQKKYEKDGLVIIGIDASQRDSLTKAQQFVEKMGDRMGYVVAYEGGDESKTEAAYMGAFKRGTIPTAFVIDKEGRIVWVGHPMAIDPVLEAVLAGKWDLEKARKEYAEELRREENREKAMPLIQEYFEAASESDGQEKADRLATKFMPLIETDAKLLNVISWEILTNDSLRYRDLQFALRIAKVANDVTEGKNAGIVDTYARALWDTGDKEAAIEQQKKAVELAADNTEMKAALEKRLKEYEDKMR